MDLYCQKCGEPWEHYYVHHEMNQDDGPTAKTDFLCGVGCPACKWGKKAPEKRPFRSELTSALSDALGDDTDGLAVELEDAEWIMGEKFWE